MPDNSSFASDVAAIGSIDAVPMILDVVCRTTGMGFAAVARVTPERWIACGVHDEIGFGLKPGGELKVDTTICHEIRQSGQEVVIDHVQADEAYASHPTPAMYGFQSYISVPITLKDGSFFGTLCAIDPKPRRLKTPEVMGMFRLFADLIAFHLDAVEKVSSAEAALFDARRTAELREQFIAVLGHDLRNPLAAIDGGARLLREKAALDGKFRTVLEQMQTASRRMAALIDNVLDFARGRLGGGITLNRSRQNIAPALEQVVQEFRLSHPTRTIEVELALSEAVDADAGRIAQILSNLIANALTHGAANSPIRVAASVKQGQFELSVSNQGEAIPAHLIGELFKPFYRARRMPGQEGLGLGLYIAAETARAHGGALSATSDANGTVFTLRIPAG